MRRQVLLVLTGVVLASCASPADAAVTGRLIAGPTCPVETEPPDPTCLPRPVADALVTVRDAAGRETTTRSGADGSFRIMTTGGETTVLFSDVEGLMGTPQPVVVTVLPGETVDLGEILYDTGIR
ncbi:MAG: hypothetical protein L0Z63_09120 [Actinobacteria bacterium]|nr:hypothetical protein [Actinomycetota bacterium]